MQRPFNMKLTYNCNNSHIMGAFLSLIGLPVNLRTAKNLCKTRRILGHRGQGYIILSRC